MVFNKIDLLGPGTDREAIGTRFDSPVFVSARTRDGIEELKARLNASALGKKKRYTFAFGPDDARLMSEVYRYGDIIETIPGADSITLTFTLPDSVAGKLGFEGKSHSNQ